MREGTQPPFLPRRRLSGRELRERTAARDGSARVVRGGPRRRRTLEVLAIVLAAPRHVVAQECGTGPWNCFVAV